MNEELKSLEDALSKLKPEGLSPDMLHRLDSAMSNWQQHLPADEKIVEFQSHADDASSFWSLRNLSAAAAVAILGASAAVFSTPLEQESSQTVAESAALVPAVYPEMTGNVFSVAGNAPSWENDRRPVRSVSLEKAERIILRDNTGRLITFERSRR